MKPIWGLIGGYGTLVLLAFCAYHAHPKDSTSGSRAQQYSLTVIIGITGVVLGWLVGLLVSPYEGNEVDRFAALATAATSFVSGYLVSKIDPAITDALSKEKIGSGGGTYFMRLLVFVSCVMIGSITMYSFRAYIGDSRPLPRAQTKSPSEGAAQADSTRDAP